MPAAAPNPRWQTFSPLLTSAVILSHTSLFTPRTSPFRSTTHWRARTIHQRGCPPRPYSAGCWLGQGFSLGPAAVSTRPERVTGAAPGSRLPPRSTATPAPPRWRRDRNTTFPSAPFLSSPGVLYTSARSVPPGGTAGPAGRCSPAKALRAVPVGGERAAEPPGRAGNKA